MQLNGFLKNIYGILFEPYETIDNLIESAPLRQAFLVVVLLSASSCLLNYQLMLKGTASSFLFIFNLLGVLISSLIFWFVLAGFFEAVSQIFNSKSHYRQVLVLSGFSLLPWIFSAPLELIKINSLLLSISILLELGVWVWSIFLLFIGIRKLYCLETKKTWLFLAVPFLGGIISLNWVSQFFTIITNIF